MKREYRVSWSSKKRELDLFCRMLSLEFYDIKLNEKDKSEVLTPSRTEFKYKPIIL